MEEGSFPVWKGLFDWSMKFQDGTRQTKFNPEDFTPERRAWLEEALKHYMKDFADRMKQIKEVLERPQQEGQDDESLLEEREALLEELMDIVASVDYARDLHKIGGLPPLLGLLRCRHPSLRWRAAEVVATCAANNAPVQLWFLEGGALPPLMQLLADEDATCRTKALLALSAVMRHFAPGLVVFRASGGVAKLVALCSDPDVRVQRKAMALLQYVVVRDRSMAGPEACELGIVAAMVRALGARSEDGAAGPSGGGDEGGTELRQAAISVLLELARSASTWAQVEKAAGLTEALQRLRDRHAALPADDREAEQEEDELAMELQQLLAHADVAAAVLQGGVQQQQQQESDHVDVDMSESNLRGVSKPATQPVNQQQACMLPPGGGGMMLGRPKADMI